MGMALDRHKGIKSSLEYLYSDSSDQIITTDDLCTTIYTSVYCVVIT